MKPPISRRDFMKFGLLSVGSLALDSFQRRFPLEPDFTVTPTLPRFQQVIEFPQAERLGRACATLEIKSRPDPESETLGYAYEDYVLPWVRETVGYQPNYVFSNQKWVETPEGYIYGAYFQPVRNELNAPVEQLPQTSLGTGMWAQVNIPYVDIKLINEPSDNSWVSTRIDQGQPLRIYYGQLFWIDRLEKNEYGQVLYRVNPNYYGGIDLFWTPAEAMKPIFPEDLQPVNPEIENKSIKVDLTRQSLSCYEGDREVFYCPVSTGAIYDMYGNIVDNWITPAGVHRITRKYVSLQMSGGTTGAPYDLPGIGWSTIFATGGVAIHSTFWHNNFGDPMSHGCVNVTPDDARWIFLWSLPNIPYDPGTDDVTVSGHTSTVVEVFES